MLGVFGLAAGCDSTKPLTIKLQKGASPTPSPPERDFERAAFALKEYKALYQMLQYVNAIPEAARGGCPSVMKRPDGQTFLTWMRCEFRIQGMVSGVGQLKGDEVITQTSELISIQSRGLEFRERRGDQLSARPHIIKRQLLLNPIAADPASSPQSEQQFRFEYQSEINLAKSVRGQAIYTYKTVGELHFAKAKSGTNHVSLDPGALVQLNTQFEIKKAGKPTGPPGFGPDNRTEPIDSSSALSNLDIYLQAATSIVLDPECGVPVGQFVYASSKDGLAKAQNQIQSDHQKITFPKSSPTGQRKPMEWDQCLPPAQKIVVVRDQ